MKKIICVFLIISLSNSCVYKDNYEAPIFNNQESLVVEIINDDFMFRSIDFMCTYDSLLIVCDRFIDPVVHVFNKNSGDLINSIGKMGQGPGELVIPTNVSFDHKNGRVFIYDTGKDAIISFDINNAISAKMPTIEEIRFNNNQAVINYSYYLRDSLFILRNGLGEIVLGTKNQTINQVLLNGPESIDPLDWRMFLSSYSLVSINPKGNKFILGTTIGGVLYIYSISHSEITLEETKYFFKPVFERKGSIFKFDNSEFGFCSLYLSDHYIYSIVFGQKNPTKLPQTICKFDYLGNPVTRYTVEYEVAVVTVDDDEKDIYMAVYKDGELALAKASL